MDEVIKERKDDYVAEYNNKKYFRFQFMIFFYLFRVVNLIRKEAEEQFWYLKDTE